jgi:hypothetical protein
MKQVLFTMTAVVALMACGGGATEAASGLGSAPAMGSDDDDPTASSELGLGLATPVDLAALDAFMSEIVRDGGIHGLPTGDKGSAP